MSARWTASGFRSTNVRSAISGPFLRLFRGLRGRRGSFLFFLLRLLPLAPLHFGPLSVEPGLEDAAAFLGVLPGRELGLFDVGHRLRAVLLLGPAEDRRPEGWALDEGREEFLDLSSREVRTEPFVDQVGEVRRDVLALRRLDRCLAGGGLGGRGHLLGDDRLFGRGPSGRRPRPLPRGCCPRPPSSLRAPPGPRHFFIERSLPERSSSTGFALPGSKIAIEAVALPSPTATPSSCLLGTYA